MAPTLTLHRSANFGVVLHTNPCIYLTTRSSHSVMLKVDDANSARRDMFTRFFHGVRTPSLTPIGPGD